MVIEYQNHHHTDTCYKRHSHCRFGFPRGTCEKTRLLDEEEMQKNHGRFLEIKRLAAEQFLNNYHPLLMRMFQCNMDIQLVHTIRGVAFYIGKYMSKPEPMMLREDTRNAINAAKADKTGSYYQQARRVANAVMTHREVSSQEAVYRIAHLPYRDSSRGSVYIPACRPADRLRMVNKDKYLQGSRKPGMNIIDRYMLRPHTLRHICLYEFASWWRPRTNQKTRKVKVTMQPKS